MKARLTRAHTNSERGYSLIEMMIVVTIVGILSAVAIPSFVGYLRKSKASEAIAFLAAIKQRQAAYFSEMGQYCDVATANPSTMPSDGNTAAWTNTSEWVQLGASPDTPQVYFQYVSRAGAPGSTPATPFGDGNARGYNGSDFWFVSRALGDLDGDGTLMTFESYSASGPLWMSDSKGWE